jgi:hypothetical protein
MENRVDPILENLDTAGDDLKKAYIERVWNMTKGELFNELMRVQAESAKIITASHNEIVRLQGVLRELESGSGLH